MKHAEEAIALGQEQVRKAKDAEQVVENWKSYAEGLKIDLGKAQQSSTDLATALAKSTKTCEDVKASLAKAIKASEDLKAEKTQLAEEKKGLLDRMSKLSGIQQIADCQTKILETCLRAANLRHERLVAKVKLETGHDYSAFL